VLSIVAAHDAVQNLQHFDKESRALLHLGPSHELPILDMKRRILLAGCSAFLLLTSIATEMVWARGPAPTGVQSQQQSSGMGVSTGEAYAPVLDAEKRPITAGGYVKAGPILFQNVAEKAGLTTWREETGTPNKTYILDTVGAGVALLDYDHDGWLDIYLVNGATYDSISGKTTSPQAALFHNNHDGTFTNVADAAGVTNDRWGEGVAVGDFDNDGWPDLYVTNFGKNRLYRNNHDGTFTDTAGKAGVALGNWSTGATFGDYDGDGRLDLFVAGYVHFDIAHPANLDSCQFRSIRVMCGPRGLPGEGDHLFHNNGDGTFTDVSVKAGVSDPNHYYGLSTVFADVNNDGRVDLVVANDSTPNYLYINKGNGTFEDDSYSSGYALNESGRETASMGIAIGDYRNNGLLDIYITTFSDDYNPLYRNDGDANFTDVSYQMGIADITIPFLGWGDGFIDYDNDGWKDIFVGNGHVYPQVDGENWGTSYAQRPLLFHNIAGKKWDVVPVVNGTGLAATYTARGVAFGDLFNNGKIDVVINQLDGVPVLLRNVTVTSNHWIEFHLIGGPKSPRDATGATVYLTAGGIRQRGDVLSGGSFASNNDSLVHFGLGTCTKVDQLSIHWPDRTTEKVDISSVDRHFTIQEGKGIVKSVYAPEKLQSHASQKPLR
jgi:hypothetical protein